MRSRRNMAGRTAAGRAVLFGVLLSALVCVPAGAGAPPPRSAAEPARLGRDSGWFLSTGWVWDRLRLNYDRRVADPQYQLTPRSWGYGPSFGAGYTFGPRFRTEFTLSVSPHEAQPSGTQGGFLAARFSAQVPLVTRGRIRPHLVGGCGWFMAVLDPELAAATTFRGMIGGDFGAGAGLILSAHWSMQADYVHSLLNIELAGKDKPKHDPIRAAGGNGWSDVLRVGFSYNLGFRNQTDAPAP
jgi:hypothetical protein